MKIDREIDVLTRIIQENEEKIKPKVNLKYNKGNPEKISVVDWVRRGIHIPGFGEEDE